MFWKHLAPLALSLALCVPLLAPCLPRVAAPRVPVASSSTSSATTLILPHRTEHIDSRALAGWGCLLPFTAYLSGYRMHYQQRQLSCEAAAVSMATNGALSEQQVVAAMPISDNPWLGFRGNLDLPETLANGLQDYGILAPPMARAVQSLGYETRVVIGLAAPQLLRYAIAVLHRPVVVWVSWRLEDWPTIVGHADGTSFTLELHEHANTVIGYDQGGVWVLDPWDGGPLYHSWATFLHVWLTYFHGMSLLLAPRFRASSPRGLKARVVGRDGVWSWAGCPGYLYSRDSGAMKSLVELGLGSRQSPCLHYPLATSRGRQPELGARCSRLDSAFASARAAGSRPRRHPFRRSLHHRHRLLQRQALDQRDDAGHRPHVPQRRAVRARLSLLDDARERACRTAGAILPPIRSRVFPLAHRTVPFFFLKIWFTRT